MSWLDTKVKSTEVAETVAGNVAVEITSPADKYFEFDDNTTGVDIDGYLFFPRKVESDTSHSHREFLRTKIMSGGEFVSRGQYVSREYEFDTIIDINPDDLDDYYNIFTTMENKICTITSPYMGGMFKGEVSINVTNPESSPHVIECKVKIKEIPDVMARLKNDPPLQYPSTTTVSDVKIKDKGTTVSLKTNDEEEHPQRYDGYYGKKYEV